VTNHIIKTELRARIVRNIVKSATHQMQHVGLATYNMY